MGAPSSSEGREDPRGNGSKVALPCLFHQSGFHQRRRAAGSVPYATVDEIEAIVTAEGAAVMTDEQAARFEEHLSEGVTCDGFAR